MSFAEVKFCPTDFRAHDGNALVDEVLGNLLAGHVLLSADSAKPNSVASGLL